MFHSDTNRSSLFSRLVSPPAVAKDGQEVQWACVPGRLAATLGTRVLPVCGQPVKQL